MVLLRDVAKKSGVSVSTASRALNGSSQISDEVKQKIVDTAKEMGYEIRGRGGKEIPEWNCAGIIVPEVASDYYSKIVHEAMAAFKERGYTSIVKVTDFSSTSMVEAIKAMHRIQVKCLMIVADIEEALSERILQTIRRTKLPVILITGKYYNFLDFDCIYIDEYSAISIGVQHLCQRGYKKIAFLADKFTAGRMTLFKQILKTEHGIDVDPQYLCIGKERMENGGYLRMKELLSLPELPDAVFCGYDHMAIGAIRAVMEYGKSVPNDIGILGFDNIDISEYVAGGISTVASPYEEMISIAVNILLKRVKNPHTTTQQVALHARLLGRATT